jgi:hypothetical protein
LPEDAARPLRRGRVQSAALSAKLGPDSSAPPGDAPVTADPKIWRAPRTRRVSSFWALHIGAARSVA